ncbi:MAG TPA: hypothetical protein VME69_02910 [Methylocella sp.]|nr:hypothetical protein [Methylocella sp.]
MPEITLRINPELARALSKSKAGVRAVLSTARQALAIVQASGGPITYAPVSLPDGGGCAMSARAEKGRLVIDIDRPDTLIAGRGVVPAPQKTNRKEMKETKSSPVRRR